MTSYPLHSMIGQLCGGENVGIVWTSLLLSNNNLFLSLFTNHWMSSRRDYLKMCSVHLYYSLRQLTTALSHTTDILSSIPFVPSGIRVKSSLPTAFWAVEKLAWALDVTWRSPLEETHKTVRFTWDTWYVEVECEAIIMLTMLTER